jgi:hypothetical protein
MSSKEINTLPASLKNEVEKIIKQCPQSKEVFGLLIKHFQREQSDEKRKKTENTTKISSSDNTSTLEGTNIMLQLPDLSIQSPFRKRLNLVFGSFKGEKKAYLALTKSMDSKPEFLLNVLTPENIKFAAIINVPEKKSLRYLLIEYIENEGNLYKNDPVLIQFNNDIFEEQFGSILSGKTFVQYLTSQLSLVDFKVYDYTSNEDTFFVQSYKGNKEGYLYFLPNHVIFGFKKPIYIFNSTDIESITYNSITRLTFNVLFDVKINGIVENFEFSMIDQKEFEEIDKYVKTKDVRDNSMADEHKAQQQYKNNVQSNNDLAEAAKLVPGGDQIVSNNNNADDDDDEEDDNYHIGDSEDDHSDASDREDNNNDDDDNNADGADDGAGDDDDDDEAEDGNYNNSFANVGNDYDADTITPGTFGSIDDYSAFDDNLQQELQDLQKDLDIDVNELQKAGYINM